MVPGTVDASPGQAPALFRQYVANNLRYWHGWLVQHAGQWQVMSAEADNVARAVELALQMAELRDAALSFLALAQNFVLKQGASAFREELLRSMVEALHSDVPRRTPTQAAISVLTLAGQLYQRRGLLVEAEACYRQALQRAEALPDDDTLAARAEARIELGRFLAESGQPRGGVSLLEEALALARQCQAHALEVRALSVLGWYYNYVRDGEAARTYLLHALPIAETLGDPDEHGRVLANLGSAYWRIGEYHRAQDALERAHARFEQAGNQRMQVIAWLRLGILHYERDRFAQAVEHFQLARQVCEQLSDYNQLFWIYQNLGAAYWGLREWSRAEFYSERALLLGLSLAYDLACVEVRLNLAEIYLDQGKVASAAPLLAEARAGVARHAGGDDMAAWEQHMTGLLTTLEARLAPDIPPPDTPPGDSSGL